MWLLVCCNVAVNMLHACTHVRVTDGCSTYVWCTHASFPHIASLREFLCFSLCMCVLIYACDSFSCLLLSVQARWKYWNQKSIYTMWKRTFLPSTKPWLTCLTSTYFPATKVPTHARTGCGASYLRATTLYEWWSYLVQMVNVTGVSKSPNISVSVANLCRYVPLGQ